MELYSSVTNAIIYEQLDKIYYCSKFEWHNFKSFPHILWMIMNFSISMEMIMDPNYLSKD